MILKAGLMTDCRYNIRKSTIICISSLCELLSSVSNYNKQISLCKYLFD